MRKTILLLSCVFLVNLVGASAQQSLGDIARQVRAAKNQPASNPAPAQNAQNVPDDGRFTVPLQLLPVQRDDVKEYSAQVSSLFGQSNFAELDRLADDARSGKLRFAGGSWKIYTLYALVAEVSAEEPDMAWLARIAKLKEWMRTRPNSVTAPIALAQLYTSYAFFARGTRTADQVTEDGWKLYEERVQMAQDILTKRVDLSEKCPQWYRAMQDVALEAGWPQQVETALFERAIAYEPEYQYYYRAHAHYLLPKWYGEDGESQAFAKQIADRIGGKQGNIIYFDIASEMICGCSDDETEGYSWIRILQGYNALQQKYGAGLYRLNRLALVATQYHDAEIANQAFARIGGNWDEGVWGTKKFFDRNVKWATDSANETVDMRYQDQVSNDFRRRFAADARACARQANLQGESFDLFLQIDVTGKFEKVMTNPAMTACLTAKLQDATFAPRPKSAGMVHVVLDRLPGLASTATFGQF